MPISAKKQIKRNPTNQCFISRNHSLTIVVYKGRVKTAKDLFQTLKNNYFFTKRTVVTIPTESLKQTTYNPDFQWLTFIIAKDSDEIAAL